MYNWGVMFVRNIYLDIYLQLERHIPHVEGPGQVDIIQDEHKDCIQLHPDNFFIICQVLEGPPKDFQYLIWNLCQKLVSWENGTSYLEVWAS